MDAVIRKPVALAAAKVRLAKSRNGSIGSATRSSQARKPATSNAPVVSAVTTSPLLQPAWLARATPHTSAEAPPITRVTPTGSNRTARPRLSARRSREHTTAATPIGTLTPKIQRQG